MRWWPPARPGLRQFWKIRHSVSEGSKKGRLTMIMTGAVPLSQQATFVTQVVKRIAAYRPDARIVMPQPAIGDGQHPYSRDHSGAGAEPRRMRSARTSDLASTPSSTKKTCRARRQHQCRCTRLGIANRERLARVLKPTELRLLAAVRQMLDPSDDIMNPEECCLLNEAEISAW